MISDHIRIQDNEQNVRLDALESNDFEFNSTLKHANTTMESIRTELKEDIGENNENFKQLSQDLNVKTASKINEVYHDLEKKITKVENVIDLSVKPGLTTLQGKVDSQADKMDNHIRLITQSESAISNLQYETRLNISNNVQSLENMIVNLQSETKGNINKLKSEINSNDGKIVKLQSQTKSNKGKITNLKSEINSNNGKIASLQSETRSNEGKITSLESETKNKIVKLQSETKTNKGEIVNLQSQTKSNEGKITNLESETKGNITNLQSEINSNDGKIVKLSTTMVSVKTELKEKIGENDEKSNVHS